MRLINTTTLHFQEFEGSDIPSYAILSHRWGDDEVTHQDFLATIADSRRGYGWLKTLKACDIAKRSDIEWLWVDTCCIDKKSSAELSEAINSMWKYYQGSTQCYAFLPDVELLTTVLDASVTEQPTNSCQEMGLRTLSSFRNSVWFSRGWTLQELLAPRIVHFFDKSFRPIGTKSISLCDRSFCEEIAKAAGIRAIHLWNFETPGHMERVSVAERMSWAAGRSTLREEDRAYCLLGLFGVNMPLLYGEGPKAFMRLQLELLKRSDDESIFAWNRDVRRTSPWRGLLAPSADQFEVARDDSGEPLSWLNAYTSRPRRPFAMTHKGLEVTLDMPVSQISSGSSQRLLKCLMPLNCQSVAVSGPDVRRQVGIRIVVKSLGQRFTMAEEGDVILYGSRISDTFMSEGPEGTPVDMYWAGSVTSQCDVVLNHPGPATILTIYFKQDGL